MTRRPGTTVQAALLGGLSALAVVGLSYLGWHVAHLPFVPLDVFDWLARVLPGPVINLTIETMVKVIRGLGIGPTWTVAKTAEQLMGMALIVLTGAAFGVGLALLGRRRPDKLPWLGAGGGLVLLAGAVAAEATLGFPAAGMLPSLVWLTVLFLAWGALLGSAVRVGLRPADPALDPGRRRFLWLVGLGSFTVAASALGVKLLSKEEDPAPSEQPQSIDAGILEADGTSGPAASPAWAELQARLPAAPGTRAELTPTDNFYRIDINTRPPRIDGGDWRLEVKGQVERRLRLSLADLRSRRTVHQAATLSCISNPVGGDLISTCVWSGVPLKEVLAEAGLRPEAGALNIRSADGFYESVGLAEAMDERTLLVHSMNGEPLTAAHGFPLRIFIPGHYGMKQPKWIVSLEAVDKVGPGYWVDRSWDVRAVPKTTSVVDRIVPDRSGSQPGTISVGGIAYAGQKGISRVEVQVDGGPWTEVRLRRPPLGPLTWVEWRYDWPAGSGRHVFRVRAYNGQGVLQETDSKDTFPAGATGIHERQASIRGD